MRGLKFPGQSLSTTLAINGGTDDATGITGTFTTRIQTGDADVLESVIITYDSYGGTGAGFGRNHCSLIRKETVALFAKSLKSRS